MTMEKFTEHTGIGAPLRISDVDTDQIFPARFCSGVTKDGLGDALFGDWRSDPGFLLNQPAYRDATVLVAGENFGTGSSREWAVWTLQDYGFRAILSPRFGDIFRGNSLKTGLLTVELPRDVIAKVWDSLEARPDQPITVDLVRLQVRVGDACYPFTLDEHTRWRLLNGYDDIGLTLAHVAEIDAYEAGRRRRTLPTARHIEPKVPHHA
jgi:3-isopropylmalate/(R)-2-methylmalate dehydratase small subunit